MTMNTKRFLAKAIKGKSESFTLLLLDITQRRDKGLSFILFPIFMVSLFLFNGSKVQAAAHGFNGGAAGETVNTFRIRGPGGVLREFKTTYTGSTETWQWKRDYLYGAGRLLATEGDGSTPFDGRVSYHHDHLGTPRYVAGEGGVLLAKHTYTPFGEEVTLDEPDTAPMSFTGHERDADDLDYMRARYYQPSIGRFTRPDPARADGWSLYSYVNNNPMNNIDPTGLFTFADAGNFLQGKINGATDFVAGVVVDNIGGRTGTALATAVYFTGSSVSDIVDPLLLGEGIAEIIVNGDRMSAFEIGLTALEEVGRGAAIAGGAGGAASKLSKAVSKPKTITHSMSFDEIDNVKNLVGDMVAETGGKSSVDIGSSLAFKRSAGDNPLMGANGNAAWDIFAKSFAGSDSPMTSPMVQFLSAADGPVMKKLIERGVNVNVLDSATPGTGTLFEASLLRHINTGSPDPIGAAITDILSEIE